MAWDAKHKVVGGNGQITMTPGYLSETIALGDATTDASTSHINYPTKADFTVLVTFTIIANDSPVALTSDTAVAVEHSVDGSTYIKQGQFETGTMAPTDISKEMHLISYIDEGENDVEDGMMMMFDIDSHGMAPYTRFTVKANGSDESANQATFHIIPHF